MAGRVCEYFNPHGVTCRAQGVGKLSGEWFCNEHYVKMRATDPHKPDSGNFTKKAKPVAVVDEVEQLIAAPAVDHQPVKHSEMVIELAMGYMPGAVAVANREMFVYAPDGLWHSRDDTQFTLDGLITGFSRVDVFPSGQVRNFPVSNVRTA